MFLLLVHFRLKDAFWKHYIIYIYKYNMNAWGCISAYHYQMCYCPTALSSFYNGCIAMVSAQMNTWISDRRYFNETCHKLDIDPSKWIIVLGQGAISRKNYQCNLPSCFLHLSYFEQWLFAITVVFQADVKSLMGRFLTLGG